MKFSIKNYWLPTPKVIRKTFDFILGLCLVLSGAIAGSPLDSDTKVWLMFVITTTGGISKYVSNFFKDENVVATKETDNL